jgi:hypothetical protein
MLIVIIKFLIKKIKIFYLNIIYIKFKIIFFLKKIFFPYKICNLKKFISFVDIKMIS